MTAAIVRLLPGDEHALLKAYVEGTSEPANAAAIYDTLEVPAGATPPRLAIAVAQIHLRELREQFGNLGLAAAAYNAGPGRVRAWLASHRPLPGETRNYVAMVTGWTADDKPASIYEAFPAPEARRLVERFEWHYTPKHGSWLDMAESELGVLASQCLDRRIADKQILAHEVTAWQDHRNKHHAKADWQFTTANARVKLKRLYPQFE